MLSDFVIDSLAKENIKHVFMVSGGGGMFLIDSLGRRQDMKYICNHHEQASAMAAEGYQRITENIGVALVTTGPAATNTLTGVLCAWNDSIPVIFISGQSNSKFLIGDTGLRQRGVHEVDIVNVVKNVTKYAVTIKDENMIKYHVKKAIYLATHGRPGPVWLDIPLDIQSKLIDPKKLVDFDPVAENLYSCANIKINDLDNLLNLLKESRRPIVLAGHGIRLSKSQKEFLNFIENHKIPVVTTKNAFDIISDDHELLAGRVGINSQRAGNFAIQNSDLIIILGSRLSFPTIGYATNYFGREAKKILVEIDETQIKHCLINPDLIINTDVKNFLAQVNDFFKNKNFVFGDKEWLKKCHHWREKYPNVPEEWKKIKKYVNSYYFFEVLSNVMKKDDILVTDQGATFYSFTVSFKTKKNQKAFTNGGFSPMGYGLPAAIGACFAADKKRNVICVHGDGGLQMNIQELQTVVHHNLPLKLFVFNNQGYLSIKHTQTAYFNGHFVGCDPNSGISCPNILKIAKAYGIKTYKISNHANILNKIEEAINYDGPVIVEVILDPMQLFQPKVASEKKPDGRMVSKPLEDMYPFLDREEFYNEMIIKPIKEN